MQELHGVLRNYPWGSRTLLAALRGAKVPADKPEAEMWFGAHPAAPATVEGSALTDIIAADPEYQLGQRVRERFGDRLPFLVKLLAAAEPLSLQAHPSTAQAEAGFTRENEQGIDVAAPHRSYRDASHKPEIIVALTPFRALSGFRPVDQTVELLRLLDVPALAPYVAMLTGDGEHGEDESESGEDGNLRALFTTWITVPSAARRELIDALVSAAKAHVDRDDWIGDALKMVVDLNERYPGDAGVLGALLLNVFSLQPGEALFTPAGQLHAYLSGLGVEVMANSDNVLRGGLTSKHVDVPELMRVLRFVETRDARVETDGEGRFDVELEEFTLRRCALRSGESLTVDHDGPVVILCVAGNVDGLGPAGAGWIPAGAEADTFIAGHAGAEVFVVQA